MKTVSFSFQPSKLIAVKDDIIKKFPTKADIFKLKQRKAAEVDLEKLLSKVKETKLSNIDFLADELKKYEIIALINNYEKIPKELLEKVNKIILYKSDRQLVGMLWNTFLEEQNNKDLISLMSSLLSKLESYNDKEQILKIIFDEKSPHISFIAYYNNSNHGLFKLFDILDMVIENSFTQVVAKMIFSNCEKKTFDIESNENLLKVFSGLKLNGLYSVVENYLLTLENNEFEESIMYKIKDRLGDPREDFSTAWVEVSNNAREKASSWLNYKRLKEFFDSIKTDQEEAQKRFDYWEKHYNDMKKVEFIEDKLQLFMIFNNFVVIEFGELGNAAYFYEKNYFDQNLAKYMLNSNIVRNDFLKKTSDANNENKKYIEKINHIGGDRGYWQRNADDMVKKFKKGRR